MGLKVNIGQAEVFQGNKIEILEMILKNVDNQLELSWKIYFENEWSIPLEVHGFEIINHSQNGCEKDSTYEIRDFEDDRVNFFCECFKMDE